MRKAKLRGATCSLVFGILVLLLVVLPGIAQGAVSGSFTVLLAEVSASDISYQSATISWKTNGNATSQVFYDTVSHDNVTAYAYQTGEQLILVSAHSLTLTGLSSATTYHYRAKSVLTVDSTQFIAISADYTFTTLPLPPVEVVPPVEVPPAVVPPVVPPVTPPVIPPVIPPVAPAPTAETIQAMPTTEAAATVQAMTTAQAATIIEEVTTDKAAAIIEQLTTAQAAPIIEQVTTAKAASILEQVAAEHASAIMEELTTDKLTVIVPAMSETSLTERLPGLSPGKLYSIEPEVLFASLPNAPTEQLVGEEPPQPPAGAKAPVVVYTTPSGARYLAVQTWAGEWVVVMGTPPPVDKLLIKTKRALQNVETTLEILPKTPPEVIASLPAGQIVRAYINISFKNAAPEDIELGHMTFKIEKEWLAQNSIHDWSVVLNRYDPQLGQWVSLPTKRVKEDESNVYYTVSITRFSTFAITGSHAATTKNFKVANLVINPVEAKAGKPITITADITDISNTTHTSGYTLWVNGTAEAGKDITLGAGETKSVSFTITRDAEGAYEVRFDQLFGSFSVTKTPLPKPIPWALISGIIAITGVIVIGVIVWLVVRRRKAYV